MIKRCKITPNASTDDVGIQSWSLVTYVREKGVPFNALSALINTSGLPRLFSNS